MKFNLDYTPKKSPFTIDHKSSLLLIGSCFAENIGTLLKEHKLKTIVNPNGILFNPISIHTCLNAAIRAESINESHVLERDKIFFSYLHHTSFYSSDKKELLQQLNSLNKKSHLDLKNADTLIITFGSAFIYNHKELGQVVANCHKQPATAFDKKLLEITEIVNVYSNLINDLNVLNPTLKIIFTVSPVKYIKDGIEENNLSKSTLLLSIRKLIAQHPNCFYFPAYELVNDDLRDYRFYKEDLAHPNHLAIEYIWQKFSECYFTPTTIALNKEIHKLHLATNHRQMQQNGLEIAKLQAFIEKQKQEIKRLDASIEF